MNDHLKETITKWLAIPVVVLPIIFSIIIAAEDDETPAPTSLYNGDDYTHEWTASEIELPHLKNGNRYTSNPDNVVSDYTVSLVDATMKRMDDELGIESAVVVVNHLANDDPFTFAQDLFDLYKIGREDRGLVVVLAYGDHSVRTHTGRSLEADLTDAECSRLQNDYLIPWMREEQPDSGLISLTEALYQTLRQKQNPAVDALMPARHGVKSDEDEDFTFTDFLILAWIVCLVIIISLNNEGGASSLFSGGGGGRWSGGGGGWSGGYGGGSSGGGGATSRW